MTAKLVRIRKARLRLGAPASPLPPDVVAELARIDANFTKPKPKDSKP